jgi:hypothetical protein
MGVLRGGPVGHDQANFPVGDLDHRLGSVDDPQFHVLASDPEAKGTRFDVHDRRHVP